MIVVNMWLVMYSANGTSFSYSQWYIVGSLNLTAIDGLVLIAAGAVCGILILIGAVLQYSGMMSRVRWGSVLVLAGTIIGLPTTSFGWILGGLLSVLGAALGFGWQPTQSL